MEFLPNLVTALVVFFLGLYLAGVFAGMVHRALKQRKANPKILLLGSKITRWTVVTLGIIVALQQVNFNVTAFLTGLGIVGFTIGFALQDVSKNFIAGILILIQQPFDLGDAIQVSGFTGTVLAIDLRATELHTYDGEVVFIPNGEIFTNPITNYSRAARRRVNLNAGVAYESDLEKVRSVALKAIAQIPGLLIDPEPSLKFQAFGSSTVDLTIYYWIDTEITDLVTAKDVGLVAIKKAFEDAAIDMPYPTQRVYLEQ